MSEGPPSPLPSTEPDPVTPGSKTSEFGVTAISIIGHAIAFAAILWKFTPEQTADLNTALTAIVTAVVIIVSNATILWKFIESRRSIKTEAIKATGAVQSIKEATSNGIDNQGAIRREIAGPGLSAEELRKRAGI